VDFGCLEWPDGVDDPKLFHKLTEYHDDGQCCEIVYRHVNGTKVDLFLFPRIDEQRGFTLYGDEFPRRATLRQIFDVAHFQFSRRTIWGRDFRIFEDPGAWLEANYGPHWRVPDRTFMYKEGDVTHAR
jgi:hypothetical protein